MDFDELYNDAMTIHDRFKNGTTKKQLQLEFSDFCVKAPLLFNMCCSNNFDKDNLNILVNVSKKLQCNEVSQDEASIEFGSKILHKYMPVKNQK
jgi:hypothetical protein